MNKTKTLLTRFLTLTPFVVLLASQSSLAQQSGTTPASPKLASASTYVAPPWVYQTRQLQRNEIDALLFYPAQVVVIDVRRPDELIKNGSFPVFLSIQLADLEKSLDLIPKDRTIITVSNRAHRAGAAGDLLTAKGYKVAGAAGSLDYEDQGGKIARIVAPPPRSATTTSAANSATTSAVATAVNQ
ncbi:rhodanese-like domain-containing protein [Undibacterium amnicola]|uniref:Rhodanese-like domain-containing protein n=1 Tax=Undibacterium amnicola TaxID=1834038 RepID=A0ABR6XTD2_9BURK|nr:rhodanese-like domain-containing protein [Undibacterium amnicola]MBC3832729.1 rhodanese-like domain-containing protein [Undibacterium amnicola]